MTISLSLEKACDLITDGTHYTPKDIGKGIPFLTVKDVYDNRLDFEYCSFVSDDDYRSAMEGNSAPQLGDVLFSKDGTVGKVHVVATERPFAVLSSLAILRPKRGIVDPRYLGHVLKFPSVLHSALKRKTGSAIRRIVLSDLKRIEIPVPSIEDQRRIAAILDAADALRAKRHAALAKIDMLPQSIFIETFGNPEHISNYRPLGEYLEFLTSGGRGWAEFYTSSGSRFIRSLDVQMNYIGNEDIALVTPPDNAEARRTRIEPGDVLLTITGSRIGRVASVPRDFRLAYISQHVAILRLCQSKLLPTFLSFFLSLAAGGQRQIAKVQYGQTKPGLNFEQIRAFRIPVPHIDHQKLFCDRFGNVTRLRRQLERSLAELDDLFVSLQHRSFRGEL